MHSSERFPLKVSITIVRSVAGEVFILAALALVLQNVWLVLVLFLDFGLRSIVQPQWSPLRYIAARLISPRFGSSRKEVFYSPKRFAAAIGFSLSALSLAGFLAHVALLSVIPLLLLSLFSFLEATLNYCAGCKIYGILMRSGIIPVSWCPECVKL